MIPLADGDPDDRGGVSPWLLVLAILLLVRGVFMGGPGPPRPAPPPTVREVPGLAAPLTTALDDLSVVALPGDSLLVAWTQTTASGNRDYGMPVIRHWCFLGAFGRGERWSRSQGVDLGTDERVELLRLADSDQPAYLLGRATRRLFRVRPDLSLELVNRLDPPAAMAWRRFDADLLSPRAVVGAATGLVPADGGGVRQLVGVGGWDLGGGLRTWSAVAGAPTWPGPLLRIVVERGADRPVVLVQLADSTRTAARLPDGSSAWPTVSAFVPDAAGRWRAVPLPDGGRPRDLLDACASPDGTTWLTTRDSTGIFLDTFGHDLAWHPAGRLPAVAVGGAATRTLCVPSPGGRAALVRLTPEQHRYDLDNLVLLLALRGLPQRVRWRAGVAWAERGAVREVRGARLRGEVAELAGAATGEGGVIVYETVERNRLRDRATRQLRVLRYSWPR